MAYDVIIRNGTVIDGSGRPGRVADVAIEGERIAAVGDVDGTARREIDAEGHAVTPGFVDAHTHMDAQVMWDPLGTSSCWHGVTTVVMGNCGFSLAPARADAHALVVRNLERAEDIAPEAMAAGIDWTWETFAEYLDAVERRPKGINYAAYVGHSALRTWAMGERAFEEEADESDLDLMRGQLLEALKAGAIGFSTSRGANHETSDDRPVASRLASWEEVRQLVDVLSKERRGLFEMSLEPAARGEDDEIRTEFLNRLLELAVESRVPITFGVLGGKSDLPLLELLEQTTAAGGTMIGQSHSRGVVTLQSFRSTLPFDNLPQWRELRSLPFDAQRQMLSDKAVVERLADAADRGEYGRAIGSEARKPDFNQYFVMNGALPPYRSVASIASERGIHPVALMAEMAVASNLEQLFIQPLSSADPAWILPFLKHPQTVMTFSDSGAHVSQIVDCSIQTHFLAYWVRQRNEFALPEAVRMLTAVPAAKWNIPERGLLREGFMADVNIFDPERIAPGMPEVVHDLPGGARRLRQGAEGILATLVNGEVVLEEGNPTGALSGKLVRDAGRHF